jgi:RHS repeat-associated protein
VFRRCGRSTLLRELATGTTTEYTWDQRNRLTRVLVKSASGQTIRESNYTYDPFDRRIGVRVDPDGAGPQAAQQSWTVYDGTNPYADFNGSGALADRYLYGAAVDQILADLEADGDLYWYLSDHLGSVRDLATEDACHTASARRAVAEWHTATLVDHIRYDSFGRVLSESNATIGDRFKYTGREYDAATGLYYYRARYYDPATGRFLSQDPIGFEGEDENLYRYVGNAPTGFTDPLGLESEPPLPRDERDRYGDAVTMDGKVDRQRREQERQRQEDMMRMVEEARRRSQPPPAPIVYQGTMSFPYSLFSYSVAFYNGVSPGPGATGEYFLEAADDYDFYYSVSSTAEVYRILNSLYQSGVRISDVYFFAHGNDFNGQEINNNDYMTPYDHYLRLSGSLIGGSVYLCGCNVGANPQYLQSMADTFQRQTIGYTGLVNYSAYERWFRRDWYPGPGNEVRMDPRPSRRP